MQDLCIKLSKLHANFLLENLKISSKISNKLNEEKVFLTFEEAEQLREKCADLLMVKGFDENYEPTPLGVTLEELIDKLYVD